MIIGMYDSFLETSQTRKLFLEKFNKIMQDHIIYLIYLALGKILHNFIASQISH